MARYIDADYIIEQLENILRLSPDNESDDPKVNGIIIGLKGTISIVERIQTADVVPKSEYDAVVNAVDNSTQEFLKLHDEYQKQKIEIEALKIANEKMYSAIEATKAEVAKEIFENLQCLLIMRIGVNQAIAELKKKYTEEET